jgi:hypothetical protein
MLDEVGSEMEDLATLISTYNRGEHELAMLRTAASSVNGTFRVLLHFWCSTLLLFCESLTPPI